MYIRLLLRGTLLLTLPCCLAAAQDALKVKRYRQIAHAYASRAAAKTTLPKIIRDQAKDLALDDATVKKLEEHVPKAISDAVNELANSWASDSKLAARELRFSSGRSLYLLESTEAWKQLMEEHLTREQLATWTEKYKTRYASEIKRLDDALAAEAARSLRQEALTARQEAQRLAAEDAQAIRNGNRLAMLADLAHKDMKQTLVRAIQAAIRTSETAAKDALTSEVNWLTEEYELNENQTRRLSLAVKGTLPRRFRATRMRLETLEAEKFTDENEKEYVEELKQMFLLHRHATTIDLHTDELWMKTLKSTLGVEKCESYVREKAARTKFRRDSEINIIIARLDRHSRLSIAQREQLKRDFEQFPGSFADLLRRKTGSSVYGEMPADLASVVRRVMTDKQLERMLSAPSDPITQMEPRRPLNR